jgi:hypothetical protein
VPPSFVPSGVYLRAHLWLTFAIVAAPGLAQGQTLSVRVSDAATGRPVAGAQVSLRLARVGGLTDSLGAISIKAPRPGTDTLVVGYPGYVRAVVPTTLRRGETIDVAIHLRQEAYALAQVTVAETGVPREPGLGFARRHRMGLGHFITRTEIDRYVPMKSSDILRRVPGVRIVKNRAGDHVISMARSTSRCRVQYYVDNMPMPTEELLDAAIDQRITADQAQNGNTADSRARARSKKLNRDIPGFTIDHIPPDMIEAIEVYRGAAEIPVEYRTTGSLCGVVLIWTKTGE